MDSTNIDYIEQASGRVTEQFKDKPNFENLLKVWLEGYQEIQDTLLDISKINDIEESSGAQLDNIGEIIGQPRELVDIAASGFFGFQSDPAAQPFGSVANNQGGLYYSLGDPDSGVISLSDGLYSVFLQSKIIQNNAGTNPEEVIDIVQKIFNTDIVEYFEGSGVDDTEAAVFTLNIGRDWNDANLSAFPGLDETQVADRLIPKPAGVRIEYTNEQVSPTLASVDNWVASSDNLYQTSNTTFTDL